MKQEIKDIKTIVSKFWKREYFNKRDEANNFKQLMLFWCIVAMSEAICLLFVLYKYILK